MELEINPCSQTMEDLIETNATTVKSEKVTNKTPVKVESNRTEQNNAKPIKTKQDLKPDIAKKDSLNVVQDEKDRVKPGTSKKDQTQEKSSCKSSEKKLSVKDISELGWEISRNFKETASPKRKAKKPKQLKVSRNKQYSLNLASPTVKNNLVPWLREMGKQNDVSSMHCKNLELHLG